MAFQSLALFRKLKRISGAASGSADFSRTVPRPSGCRCTGDEAEGGEGLRHHAVAVPLLDRPGEHVDLQVRPLQPLVAAHQRADIEAHAGQRPGAAEGVLHAGQDAPRQAVDQVVHGDGLGALVGDVGVEVVVQVAADARHVLDHRDAVLLQMLGRAEARQHQQLRRAVDAARDDDLAAGARRPEAVGRAVFDADRAAVLDQHAGGVRRGGDGEVLALLAPRADRPSRSTSAAPG